MDNFDKWFSRFMYATEVIFLAASMPHIAAWFAHFDNPTDWLSSFYAWGVGFALAFAIDGVAFMLLLAVTRMIRRGKTKSASTMVGLIAFMLFIALLSSGINWQYDVQNASNAFAKADAIRLFGGITIGSLNPVIGGAFQILILAYALVAKAMQGEVKSVQALSDEEFAQKKKRLEQEKELKELQKNANKDGLVSGLKQRVLGEEKDADELHKTRLTATVDYLRDATELLDISQTKKAVEMLATRLKVNKKLAEMYLIESRSVIAKDHQNSLVNQDLETTQFEEMSQVNEDFSEEENETQDEINDKLVEEQDTSQDTGQIPTNLDLMRVVRQYPLIGSWYSTGVKSVSVEIIMEATNMRRSTIEKAIAEGQLKRTANANLFRVSSVINWLKTRQVSRKSNGMKEPITGELKAVNLEN